MSAPAVKKITFQCRQCQFRIAREEKDLGRDCPKCCVAKPYVPPEAAAKQEALRVQASPASKVVRVSNMTCPKNEGQPHIFEFGKCKHCQKSEGAVDLEAAPQKVGGFAYPGGSADCKDGGKHMFMFAKCKKCGCSELEYKKAVAANK